MRIAFIDNLHLVIRGFFIALLTLSIKMVDLQLVKIEICPVFSLRSRIKSEIIQKKIKRKRGL